MTNGFLLRSCFEIFLTNLLRVIGFHDFPLNFAMFQESITWLSKT